MPESYDTIREEAQAQFVEKRSRFIGDIRPVATEEEFQKFLSGVKARHRDARHNCFAYLLREGGVMRYSDDGEPQGTAGVPMLEVLKREKLYNLGVVVTRYFGGILLGAGGLVRAYSHTAKLAVDAAERVTMCPCLLFSLPCPYPLYDRVGLLLESHRGAILDTAFTDQVALTVRMRDGDVESFQRALTELSGGQLALSPIRKEFAPM